MLKVYHSNWSSLVTETEAHPSTHIDAHNTQYLKWLSWAELGGTIMSSCLLDLLSTNRSNWMMIIVWAISSLEHFCIIFFFLDCLSFSSLHRYLSLCALQHSLTLFVISIFIPLFHSHLLSPSFMEKGFQNFTASCLDMSCHSWTYPSKLPVDLWVKNWAQVMLYDILLNIAENLSLEPCPL